LNHTSKVIIAGFVLLALCLLVGRWIADVRGVLIAALIFAPLWFTAAAINMWFGVRKAGYSFREEVPPFLLVFTVPVAAAALVVWLLRVYWLLLFWTHD
jgi:hypothetical protein